MFVLLSGCKPATKYTIQLQWESYVAFGYPDGSYNWNYEFHHVDQYTDDGKCIEWKEGEQEKQWCRTASYPYQDYKIIQNHE